MLYTEGFTGCSDMRTKVEYNNSLEKLKESNDKDVQDFLKLHDVITHVKICNLNSLEGTMVEWEDSIR